MQFAPLSRATTFTLAALIALGPLSTDMYLPALPRIAAEFSETTAHVQLTLSLFLVGFAVAQLFYGVLSDRFGRKPVMLAGLVIFTVATIGCAYSENIYLLMFFRSLQAVGGSAGPVLGRAIVRDLYSGSQASKVLSQIGSIMAVAPAIAPIIGGFLSLYYGWQSIFWFLAAYGVVGAWIYQRKISESSPPEFRHQRTIGSVILDYWRLLHDRQYIGYTLSCSFSIAGLFAFISGSSFVLIGLFGVPEQQFGWYFLTVVVGYMVGTTQSARLSHTFDNKYLVGVGSGILVCAGIIMLIICVSPYVGPIIISVPMAVFAAGVGIVMPQSLAGALQSYPHMAGTASGLLGFIQMSTAATAGIIVGHTFNDTSVPMAATIALMGVLSMLSFVILVHRSD